MNQIQTQIRLKTLYTFLLSNYILSLFLAYPLLSYGPPYEEFWPWVYTRIAFLSTFAIFMILFWLLFWPFTRFIRSSIQLFILPPSMLFAFQVFLLADVNIYEIFRYHVNGFVINTLTTEGAGDSVQLGGRTIATIILLLTLFHLSSGEVCGG